jgi:hypothetical protein
VADGHHYVDVCAADISGAQDGRSVKFIEGTLAELEITEWLHHQVLHIHFSYPLQSLII